MSESAAAFMRISALSLLLLVPSPLVAQLPAVGIIDFYGARTVSEAELRRVLPVHTGDPAPDSLGPIIRALEAVPGVRKATVSLVCCEDLKLILYIGIEESASGSLSARPEPNGEERLPPDMIAAGEGFQDAVSSAVARGDVAEDDSQGHALSHDSAAGSFQSRFVGFAARDLPLLRRVLRQSGDASHRALAAQIIAYAGDKAQIVPDLVEAIGDPAEPVRNNAMRALSVLAGYAKEHPERGIRIPSAPFVRLLDSPVWTDRNKSSLALMQLSEARDPMLLQALRDQALPSLLEMGRWKARGHAAAAFILLGRIGGMSEEALGRAWSTWDTTAVIAAAKGSP